MFDYKTKGTCSKAIHFDIQEGIVKSVSFDGGCNGNAKGIGILIEGMTVEEVIKKLKGVRCGLRPTSCPDQLAIALERYNETY
ncbi:TSCPD domain-containing protein [Spirochaetia bacterium]|nr:TSCPD domain-containing protein [Spirochaetia bacterium]GHU29962.1 TSCPD domain-containing protein [Spirochaetia bacterium]